MVPATAIDLVPCALLLDCALNFYNMNFELRALGGGGAGGGGGRPDCFSSGSSESESDTGGSGLSWFWFFLCSMFYVLSFLFWNSHLFLFL